MPTMMSPEGLTVEADTPQLVRYYEAEGYTFDAPEGSAVLEDAVRVEVVDRPKDSAHLADWVEFADRCAPESAERHAKATKAELIAEYGT